MKVKPFIIIEDDSEGICNSIIIEFERPKIKYKQKKMLLDSKKVKRIIKRLKIDIAATWADCWRDDDSPQAEKTLGTRKVA